MKFYQLDKKTCRRYENAEIIFEIKNLNNVDLAQAVIDSKKYFHNLDEREIVILLSFKCGLSWQETDNRLQKLGYGRLYAKELGDVMWIYSLNMHESITDVISKYEVFCEKKK